VLTFYKPPRGSTAESRRPYSGLPRANIAGTPLHLRALNSGVSEALSGWNEPTSPEHLPKPAGALQRRPGGLVRACNQTSPPEPPQAARPAISDRASVCPFHIPTDYRAKLRRRANHAPAETVGTRANLYGKLQKPARSHTKPPTVAPPVWLQLPGSEGCLQVCCWPWGGRSPGGCFGGVGGGGDPHGRLPGRGPPGMGAPPPTSYPAEVRPGDLPATEPTSPSRSLTWPRAGPGLTSACHMYHCDPILGKVSGHSLPGRAGDG
jgi:hypothetical protein